ncbi:MAG: ABC-ATPase UvrA, partial [Patescibacteria group bacterium]
MNDKIIITGARVHNLKNVDLEIPKNKMTVFCGVSGSGKSSLAFDTIFAEGQRRYIESLSPYARQFLGQMDRPDVDSIEGLSPSIAIDQKALSHNPRSTVGTLTEIYDYLRVLYARMGEVFCPQCGMKIQKLSLEEMVDRILAKAEELKQDTISVLSPVVIGRKGEYHQMLYDFLNLGFGEVRADGKIKSLHEQLILAPNKKHDIDLVVDKIYLKEDEGRIFEAVETALHHSNGLVTIIFGIDKKDIRGKNDPLTPLRDRSETEIILSSNWTCPVDDFSFPEIAPRLFSFNSPVGACPDCHGIGKEEVFGNKVCPTCNGKRLRPEALAIRINNKNIAEVTDMTIDKAYEFFEKYESKLGERDLKIAGNVIKEIKDRLKFLLEVGLNYITLGREAGTLSGGEAQRIRLASQLGSRLSNTLYVLDEPTIGLHERDIDKLLNTLRALKNLDNTILITEHDERTILEADYFVEIGPLAGKLGGEIVESCTTEKLFSKNYKSKSLTLKYLNGEMKIEVPKKRRINSNEKLKVIGAKINNLKGINVEIPLRRLVCLTGVSGSGKSTFLYDALYQNLSKIKDRRAKSIKGIKEIKGSEYLDKVVMINQSPIGRTPRSNPATYTGIFTPIRNFFESLEGARERGYTASRFSFNVEGGRCEACKGAGFNVVEMHFLPDVLVECEVCHGRRYNRETLQVKYKGKSIAEILAMTVDEAYDFFDGIYDITD